MPFPPELAHWWRRATGNGNEDEARCQWRFFDQNGALQQCKAIGEQVHHIIPESAILANLFELLQNPNGIEGLVVCTFHHIMGTGDIFEPHGSFHPDMGEARKNYHRLKAQGRNSFAEAAHVHHEKAERGERFWAGTPETDQFYITIAREIANRYSATHPEDPMPAIKRHKHTPEPNHWYDIFFD